VNTAVNEGKDGHAYTFTGVRITEADPANINQAGLLTILGKIKNYGNCEPTNPHETMKGVIGSGKPTVVGWKRCYVINLSLADLVRYYGTIAEFKKQWLAKTATLNNGTAVPIEINGIDEIDPIKLKVLVSGDQIAIGGFTYALKGLIDFTKLGATATNPTTFTWEREAKVFVCDTPGFTAAHIRTTLMNQLATSAPHVTAHVEIREDA